MLLCAISGWLKIVFRLESEYTGVSLGEQVFLLHLVLA